MKANERNQILIMTPISARLYADHSNTQCSFLNYVHII